MLNVEAGEAHAVVLWINLHLDHHSTISGSLSPAVSLARYALFVLPESEKDVATSLAMDSTAAGTTADSLVWEAGITASQLHIQCRVQSRPPA